MCTKSARVCEVPPRFGAVKLVVQMKLLPSPEQAAALEATLRACNRAADPKVTKKNGYGYRESFAVLRPSGRG